MFPKLPTPTIRCTIVDAQGAVSFVAAGHAGKMLTAACSSDPRATPELIAEVGRFDEQLASGVRGGLARFDEFYVDEPGSSVDQWRHVGGNEAQPFRVVSPELRDASVRPASLGVIIFNLIERRIVQVQNRYGPLQRSDRGRIRVDGKPTRRFYRYDLPGSWRIVP